VNLYRQVTIYILWEKAKRWLWLPLLLVFLAFIRFLLVSSKSSFALLDFIRDPVVSALTGAFLGGAIAFFGSVYVQKAQVKSDAAVRRRDEIYVPLYNELLSVRKSLGKKPCPYSFVYEAKDGSPFSPKFAIWTSFRSDNRHLHVPKQLAKSLDEFISVTNRYSEARREATHDAQIIVKVKEIFARNFGAKHSSRVDLTEWFLPCSSDLTNLVETLNSQMNRSEEKNTPVLPYTNEYIAKVAQEIYQETRKFEIVVHHQSLRIDIDRNLEELTNSLEKVIRYINEEFEQHEKWF
jgi:hypothetical protein